MKNRPITNAPRAEETLVHYFRTLFEAAGLNWRSDNELEIGEAVKDIIAAAVEETARDIKQGGA